MELIPKDGKQRRVVGDIELAGAAVHREAHGG
jgi:hypothetical protein